MTEQQQKVVRAGFEQKSQIPIVSPLTKLSSQSGKYSSLNSKELDH